MGRIPPWSDLPQELLTTIFEHLPSNSLDILRFRSVCKSWRSSSSSSFSLSSPSSTLFPPLPLAVPCPPYCTQFRNVAVLSATAIYALHPPIKDITPSCMPRVWITFIDQSIRGKVSIREPFSKGCYPLPVNFPRTLNLLSFHASELGRFYNLSYVTTPDGKLTKRCVCFGIIRKVVLYKNGNEFVVFALSDQGELGLLRLGLGDDDKKLGALTQSDWETVHDGKGFHLDDIVDFKDRMLGIDRRGRVYEIGVGFSSSSTVMSVIIPPIAGGGGRRKRLVESLGRLYLVVRCCARGEMNACFKVYELNGNTKKWVEVKSLGDRSFFFGIEFSFSASTEELHGSYGKNCILFKERSFLNYSGCEDDRALFLDLSERDLRIGVWRMDDAAVVDVIGSYPGYSNVLWPPPTWIWPNIKRGGVEKVLKYTGSGELDEYANEILGFQLNVVLGWNLVNEAFWSYKIYSH